jgi:hypothetical protein
LHESRYKKPKKLKAGKAKEAKKPEIPAFAGKDFSYPARS